MKILQTNFLTYHSKSYQITPYKKQENYQDVFIKNGNSQTFMGNIKDENPYQKVLENPTLIRKVMELVTSASVILVGRAAGICPNNQKDNINVDNIFNDVLEEKNEYNEEIENYKQEIEQLKEKNKILTELLEKKAQTETNSVESANENSDSLLLLEEQESFENETLSEQENYIFVFPKKKAGILSKSQKKLREITAGLNLDKVYTERLTAICKELLQNGSHIIDGEIVDNKDITNDFNEKLVENSEENIPKIIDEFYEKCGFKIEEPDNQDLQEKFLNESENENFSKDNSAVEIFETKKVILPGVVIKGKIDLDNINERPKKPPVQDNKSVIQNNSLKKPEKRPRISRPDKDFEQISQLDVKNEKTKSAIFRIPGTADKDVKLDLTRLLLHFEHLIENENPNPRYQFNQALGVKVQDAEILSELNNYKYQHINKHNISELKNAINSDARFHKMFTLHAAMRLIDRFADFNSDEPLDAQSHKILDSLVKILQKSFKEGLEVRRYIDDNGNIGLRLFLSENVYDENAKSIFGIYPFKLGICENQPDPNYYNKHNKNPLICTIFANGI